MCGFKKQKKTLTFYSQSLICHCNALVLLSFIILPYQTSALGWGDFLWTKPALSDMISMYADSVTNIKMSGYQW